MKKLITIFFFYSICVFSQNNNIIGDVNCDGSITIDDIQLLSNIWNNLQDPNDLADSLPCLEDNITGLTPDQLQEMIDMMDEQTEINVVNYNENIPLGVILPYAGINPPEGWMLCDGSVISRTEYIELFELLGTSYGDGDGTFTYDWQDENNDGQMDPGELVENLTTFNLPDFRGRVPVGRDQNETTISNGSELGNIGGEENHTLTIDEMPSHSHNLSTNNYSSSSNAMLGLSYGSPSISIESSTAGGDQPHNNMPPYLITNYIIKVVDQSPADESEYDIDPQNEIQTLSLNEDTLVLSGGNNIVLDNFSSISTQIHTTGASGSIDGWPGSGVQIWEYNDDFYQIPIPENTLVKIIVSSSASAGNDVSVTTSVTFSSEFGLDDMIYFGNGDGGFGFSYSFSEGSHATIFEKIFTQEDTISCSFSLRNWGANMAWTNSAGGVSGGISINAILSTFD